MNYTGWTYLAIDRLLDANAEERSLCNDDQREKCNDKAKCLANPGKYSNQYYDECRQIKVTVEEV